MSRTTNNNRTFQVEAPDYPIEVTIQDSSGTTSTVTIASGTSGETTTGTGTTTGKVAWKPYTGQSEV